MNGYNLYTKVQYYRQALEIGLMGDAPSQAPPRKPLALYQRIAADESEFRFQLDHRETKVAAGRVLFEITGPMPSPGRKPRPCDLRMIRDIGPKSFLPLAAKEDIYVIANARFQIGEGKRYGVRARILTGEGVPSLPVSGDFFKETGWVPRDNGSGPEAEQGELF
jgi:hypothetical protein